MRVRTKDMIILASSSAAVVGALSLRQQMSGFDLFACYLILCLISACFKVKLPGSEASLSFNVPYILLSIVWLPLPEAIVVGIFSALVMCTFRVSPPNTRAQILLNVVNCINSIAAAWFTYHLLMRSSGQALPSLVFASIVYFCVNSLTVCAVLSTLQDKSIFAIWRDFVWSLPYYAMGALLATLARSVELRFGRLTSQVILPLVYVFYCIGRNYVGRLQERNKHAAEMAALHLRTIETLAMAIEAKDQNTHDHLCRVRVYAAGIAKELQLDESQTEALMAAALLHDIGKLAVPEYIINKPGKLTPEEFEKMKIHPVVGAEILERVAFPYPVAPIVRSHHERWNGTGYPDGLKGKEIPIGARILSAVDCFDALASDRPYRRALPLSEAMAHIKELAGTQYDPKVVEILSRRYQELEIEAKAESNQMEPLHTDIVVRRGDAPSAGFEKNESNFRQLPIEAPGIMSRFEGELIHEIIQHLNEDSDVQDALEGMSSAIGKYIASDKLILFLSDRNVLRPYHARGLDMDALSPLVLTVGQGLCGWVAQSRQTILNGNPSVEVELTQIVEGLREMGAALAVPLVGSHDSLLGVLSLYQKKQDSFRSADLRFIALVQPLLTSFLERRINRTGTETYRASSMKRGLAEVG